MHRQCKMYMCYGMVLLSLGTIDVKIICVLMLYYLKQAHIL